MNEIDYISREVAAHVLYHFGSGGYAPGSFVESLLVAFSRADVNNHMRLSMAFPEYGFAMEIAKNELGGIDDLKKVLDENPR